MVGGINGLEGEYLVYWEYAGNVQTDNYWYASGTHARSDLGDHDYNEISHGGINRWHTQSWFGEWTGSSWRSDRPRDPTESGFNSRTQYRGAYYRTEVLKTDTPDGDMDRLVRFTDPQPEYTSSTDYKLSASISAGYGPFSISLSGEPISIEFGSGGTTITMDGVTNPNTPDQAYEFISWDISSDSATWANYPTTQEQSSGVKFNIEDNGMNHYNYDDPHSDKDFTVTAESQAKYLYVDMFNEYIYDETPIQVWYNSIDVV